MNIEKILEEMKPYSENSPAYVTSNPAYGCYSYPYMRMVAFPDDGPFTGNQYIEFSNKQKMPAIEKKHIKRFLRKMNGDTIIRALNIDNNKSYDIIGIGGDDDEEMGNDLYIYINDEEDD